MNIKAFIGKVVVGKEHKVRYVLTNITGAAIYAATVEPNSVGCPSHYLWKTGTMPEDNAITRGDLVFEEKELYEPFKNAYAEYFYNEGKLDQYFYYGAHYD